MATPKISVNLLDSAPGRGEWRANQHFSMQNLQCLKDERLPPRWQNADLIAYLKKTYGDDCVKFVPAVAQRPRPGRTAMKETVKETRNPGGAPGTAAKKRT